MHPAPPSAGRRAVPVAGREAAEVRRVVEQLRSKPAHSVKSIIFDQGVKYADAAGMERERNTLAFFVLLHSPRERPTKENTNGLLGKSHTKAKVHPSGDPLLLLYFEAANPLLTKAFRHIRPQGGPPGRVFRNGSFDSLPPGRRLPGRYRKNLRGIAKIRGLACTQGALLNCFAICIFHSQERLTAVLRMIRSSPV